MRLLVLFTPALVACISVPAPLGHRDEGGGAGGSEPAPLPVCAAAEQQDCARPVKIYAAGHFSCAAMDDDTVRCWGNNDSHQLGDPEVPPASSARGIVAGVKATDPMALGLRHACALVDESVLCWGRNTIGQLGTGDLVFRKAPTTVVDEAAAVFVNGNSSCALRDSGHLACWGFRLDGQGWAGNDMGAHDPLPVPVAGVHAPAALALGHFHACAVRSDRMHMGCWGQGSAGQLGDGALAASALPVSVQGLATPVAAVTAASESTCSLGGDPAIVQCWGLLPVPNQLTTTPAAVDLPGEPLAIDAGWRHACALLADGRVACWGTNDFSALGRPGGASAIPSIVEGVEDAVDLAVGRNHGCALRSDGATLCWGRNHAGQLGTSSSELLESAAALPVVWP